MTAADLVELQELHADPRRWADARSLDVAWQDAPTVLLVAADGSRHRYQLTPRETYAVVRRLVGHLEHLHPQRGEAL